MPIDLSKSLDDLLKEMEWDKDKAAEIRFGDVSALRANEYGHFKYEIGEQPIVPRSERFAQFIGTKYDAALFLESRLFLTKNPFWYLVENAWMWGNEKDEYKAIELECYFAPKGFLIVVKDRGKGFDVAEVVRKQNAGKKYFQNGGGAFSLMKKEQTCTYSYSKKGNEAYILCLTANAQNAAKTKILQTSLSPVYFPQILDTPTNTEAKS